MRTHGARAHARRTLVEKTIVLNMFCARVKAAHQAKARFVRTVGATRVPMRNLVGAVRAVYFR